MSKNKPLKFSIEDLVIENNRELYNEVIAQVKIDLTKDFKKGWMAILKNGIAFITYNHTEYPDASFTHELLHIKYELLGLSIPFVKDEENVGPSIPYIFNILCHLKFYDEFIEMGFENDEFLNDKDAEDVITVMKRDLPSIKKMFLENNQVKLSGSIALLMPYIMLKSPHDDSTSTQNFIAELKLYGEDSFFNEVDLILNDWRQNKELDSSLTFARLFKATNNPRVGFCLSGRNEDIIISGNLKN